MAVTWRYVISATLQYCKVTLSKHEVWRAINGFRSQDYRDIASHKLWILVWVSSSYERLNSGYFLIRGVYSRLCQIKCRITRNSQQWRWRIHNGGQPSTRGRLKQDKTLSTACTTPICSLETAAICHQLTVHRSALCAVIQWPRWLTTVPRSS